MGFVVVGIGVGVGGIGGVGGGGGNKMGFTSNSPSEALLMLF